MQVYVVNAIYTTYIQRESNLTFILCVKNKNKNINIICVQFMVLSLFFHFKMIKSKQFQMIFCEYFKIISFFILFFVDSFNLIQRKKTLRTEELFLLEIRLLIFKKQDHFIRLSLILVQDKRIIIVKTIQVQKTHIFFFSHFKELMGLKVISQNTKNQIGN